MTRSRGSAPSARPRPRLRVAPRGAESDGDLACELAGGYGLTPDDWQEDVLTDWLRRRADGRWASATCWLAVPRQNGKNACIEVRELYGMVELGERFLHTAHEVKTARKAFKRLLSFFENPRKYPELAAMAKEIRKTNGQEAIFLDNGASVEVIARSSGSGRGFDGIDVLICDEAQELTDDEQAALLPTISAASLGNPQVIFTGTPPDPTRPNHGEVFRRVRQEGVNRTDPRLALHDFGVPDGPLPDVDDKRLWYDVNPALGGRLNIAEAEREHKLMAPEKFAAERLGWWGDPTQIVAASKVDMEQWGKLGDRNAVPYGPVTLALAVPRDRSSTAVSVSWMDGERVFSAVTKIPGTAKAVQTVKRLRDQHDVLDIALHAGGPAGSLVADLEADHIEVTTISTRDLAAATGAFLDAVKNGAYGHVDQPELNGQVELAQTRNAEDAELWDQRDELIDISDLVAVTVSAYQFTKHAPDDYDPLDSIG